jgi:hypothetical protein
MQCMFSCKDIQWIDLSVPFLEHVLDVGGDHRLFLGRPLSGYKKTMQGSSGLGVCVFASKAFGLWQRPLGITYILLIWVPLA